MRNWLNNQTVILTGASGGIGKQLCKILINKYGANVVGIGRSEEKMLALKEELGDRACQFSYYLFDVSKRENWQRFALGLSKENIAPTLLINNAGAFPTFAKTLQTPSSTMEEIMQNNYFSVVYAVESLHALLKPNGKCTPGIVNISSSAALCSVVGTSAYSASKAALKGYTEALQLEEKAKKYIGIIYPGTTKTDLFRKDENTKNSALDIVATSAEKMAKKIAKKIIKRKKRAVVGWDAKLMNITAKLMPVKGLFLIRGVMKGSKSKVFNNVFNEEVKKKDNV